MLRSRADAVAALITAEMGKPLAEALGEVEKSAVTAEFYVTHAGEFLGDTAVEIDGADARVAREPLGLVLAIMPWNFPLWQAMRFAVPALTAGNGVFLKHSPNVTGSALLIQELCEQAGVPAGVFTTTVVSRAPRAVGHRTAHRRRPDRGCHADGQQPGRRGGGRRRRPGGQAVRARTGRLRRVRVLSDADVPAAARTAVKARFLNAGQSCVCAKRFIVESTVAEEFTEAFVAGVEALTVGDPTDRGDADGPAGPRRPARRDRPPGRRSPSPTGARVLTGGTALPGPGYFHAPTVLDRTAPGMPAFDEETFGPLAAITVATDEEDAVRLANATRFGLGLSVWSRDTSRAAAVARRVVTGAAFINAMVASDARIPFGGTKQSGYGRELSDLGMLAFVNTRTYWTAR